MSLQKCCPCRLSEAFQPCPVWRRVQELADAWLVPARVVLAHPLVWNQSLAAIIITIKAVNTLYLGNIFYLLDH